MFFKSLVTFGGRSDLFNFPVLSKWSQNARAALVWACFLALPLPIPIKSVNPSTLTFFLISQKINIEPIQKLFNDYTLRVH